MIKESVEVSRIGNVRLDDDKLSILKLQPKFAILRKLDKIEMQTEIEMGMAKVCYQTAKEDLVREINEKIKK